MEQVIAGDDDETLFESFPRLTKESLFDCKEFTTLLFNNVALINSFKYKDDEEYVSDFLKRKK